MAPEAGDRELDIALFAATGFVGRLTAVYLATAAPAGVRIGLAGRSRGRLTALREALGPSAAEWPLLVADLDDRASLAELAAATRVLVTTAGPYARRGLPVVEACVRARTHYADLAGEVLFMRESIERHHRDADANGTRIVHACGVDSIPSDLGVLLLAEQARADGAGELEDTIALVRAFSGGFSGGTVATMRGQLEDVRDDPRLERIVADPYALSPQREREPDLGGEPDLAGVERDRELGFWLGPFVMAGANTRVVRRSNALQDWAYGRRFRYREALGFRGGAGGFLKAVGSAAGLRMVRAALTSKPAQPLVARLLPAPGEGPDEEARRRGRFAMQIHARTTGGIHYAAGIAADADPGYNASSRMLGQTALCLALDQERLPTRAGVLTPATAMGTALVERLRQSRALDVGQPTPRPGEAKLA